MSTFWASFALFFLVLRVYFLALSGYFWDQGQIKKHFCTCLFSQLTVVLDVQPDLIVFNSARFEVFLFFGPFGAVFWVRVRFKHFFGTYLHKLTTHISECIALYCFFETFPRVGVVGRCNFNENQVVSFCLWLRLTTLGLSKLHFTKVIVIWLHIKNNNKYIVRGKTKL